MGDLFEIYCLVVLERSCNFNYVKLFIKKHICINQFAILLKFLFICIYK